MTSIKVYHMHLTLTSPDFDIFYEDQGSNYDIMRSRGRNQFWGPLISYMLQAINFEH